MGAGEVLKDLVLVVVGAVMAVAVWLAKQWFAKSDSTDTALWKEVNRLKSEIASVRELVAGNYVTREELQKDFQGLRQDLKELSKELRRSNGRGGV